MKYLAIASPGLLNRLASTAASHPGPRLRHCNATVRVQVDERPSRPSREEYSSTLRFCETPKREKEATQ